MGGSKHGVFNSRLGVLSNDFFGNLLDMSVSWAPTREDPDVFHTHDRSNSQVRWSAAGVDLTLGSDSQFRSICEVYGQGDAKEAFVRDFVAAWTKVMNLDRFDLQ